jgi:DNA polymerase III gamma/tau subunit
MQRQEMVERLSGLMDLELEARLQLAETMTANRKDRTLIRRQLEVLLLLARDLLLLSQGLPAQLVSGTQQETLARQAASLGAARINAYLHSLRLTMERIDQNVDPRLALEALLVREP